MTETWGVALFTGLGGAFLGILGWIAVQLRQMRKNFQLFVKKEDCRYLMQAQCSLMQTAKDRLNDITQKVWSNQQDISAIKARLSMPRKQ